MQKLFHGALQTRGQWKLFDAEVRRQPKLLPANGWVERNVTWLGRPHRTYRETYDAMANTSGVALLTSVWSVPSR